MAVWHYKGSLVPRAGILRHHGLIPEELPGYRGVWNPEEEPDTPDLNYWVTGSPQDLELEIEAMLPLFPSWSSNARMYGENSTDRLIVWLGDGLSFRFDLRQPNLDLLRRVAEMAKRHDLLWVSENLGRPIDSEFKLLLEDIMQSNAYRFCKGPKEYLLSLPKAARGGTDSSP
jgi:hypothetical protein